MESGIIILHELAEPPYLLTQSKIRDFEVPNVLENDLSEVQIFFTPYLLCPSRYYSKFMRLCEKNGRGQHKIFDMFFKLVGDLSSFQLVNDGLDGHCDLKL